MKQTKLKLKKKPLFSLLVIMGVIIYFLAINNINHSVDKDSTWLLTMDKNLPLNFEHNLPINSNNYIIYNLDSGQMLSYRNPDEFVKIASLTKIMTTLLAIQLIDDLEKKVTITSEMVAGFLEINASVAGLQVGDVVNYRDLLYGTFLASGAETSRALGILLKGSEAEFVNKMNEKAQELGLENTRFENPVGLDAEGKGSTVREVAYLLKYALENTLFKEIFLTQSFTLSNGLVVVNTLQQQANQSGQRIPFVLGGRTGFTSGAGRCLASVAYDEENNINYLLVTVGAAGDVRTGNHIRDAQTIYTYFFNNFKNHQLIAVGDLLFTAEVRHSSQRFLNFYSSQDLIYFDHVDFDKRDIRMEFRGQERLTPRKRVGETIGRVYVYYDEELIAQKEIVMETEINYSVLGFIWAHIIIVLVLLGIVITTIFFIKNKKFKQDKALLS